jgi:hypothetical protein
MVEREIISDHYQFVRSTETFFEAVERFRGLRAEQRRVLFSKRGAQKPLFN